MRSSIWVKESKETRLVWIAMIAMKNFYGYVKSSKVGLADCAKVTPEECEAALKVLLSPDPDDTSGVDEGRRIKEVPGGWQIVNNDLYRFSSEAKREFWRQQKAEQRARDKVNTPKRYGPTSREQINDKQIRSGGKPIEPN